MEPPDFYPAYRRVKARKGWEKWVGFGLYGPLRAFTRGKNQVVEGTKGEKGGKKGKKEDIQMEIGFVFFFIFD